MGLIHFVGFDTEVYHYYPDEVNANQHKLNKSWFGC